MNAPAELVAAVGEPIRAAHPVAGGDINDAWRIEFESGRAAFLKGRSGAVSSDFESEAAGLRWLEDAGAPVPAVLAVGADEPWLALEWIEPGVLSAGGADALGHDLASLHRAGAAAFGALPPTSPDRVLRIGSLRLSIGERTSWEETYVEDLVLPLVARARDAGSLSPEDGAAVESVCSRFADLGVPDEPPARLHGDLWSGNVHAAPDGRGWLIDPAAYGGHREVDLAMLRLFGTQSDRIFSGYDEAFPLADGHAARVALWQILPLLAHAVLFGGAYGRSAGDRARLYA